MLDGEDVSDLIRTPEVSEAASRAAADPAVRAAMVAEQRRLLSSGDWVAEGRDIGTVVAPDAALKVFLDATPEERARRRAAELGAAESTVRAEQAARDERDTTRALSPLHAAPDAVVLDTTGLSLERGRASGRGARALQAEPGIPRRVDAGRPLVPPDQVARVRVAAQHVLDDAAPRLLGGVGAG